MAMKKAITKEEARERMAALCARSEQCEADIRQKLYRLGFPSGIVQEIVTSLMEEKFIDNARFAGCFARDKCRFSLWGRNKIRLYLAAKRISSADIAKALESIDEKDYLYALHRTAATKARGMNLSGSDGRENRLLLFRHLVSRGFESSLASMAIKEILNREE